MLGASAAGDSSCPCYFVSWDMRSRCGKFAADSGLIAMLLIKYLQLRARFGWSLSNLVALLRQQLFVYRDLWTWIDHPFQPPPVATTVEQLPLGLH